MEERFVLESYQKRVRARPLQIASISARMYTCRHLKYQTHLQQGVPEAEAEPVVAPVPRLMSSVVVRGERLVSRQTVHPPSLPRIEDYGHLQE